MNNEEKAVKLFQGIADVGDDLIEEAGRLRKRKKMPPWRWGLAAACLCLALVGTGAAARFSGTWMRDGGVLSQNPDYTGVAVGGGMVCYPVDILSEEVRALDGTYTVKSFKSWKGMEEFIGVNLMDNPVLDAASKPRIEHIYDNVQGRFFARVSALLDRVFAIGYYGIECVDIEVEATLFTERAAGYLEQNDERYTGIYFPPDWEVMQEGAYTAPNGLEAQIAQALHPDGRCIYVASFSSNGIFFVVRASSEGDVEACRAVLTQVLSSFQ